MMNGLDSAVEQPLRAFLTAGEQEVDLNCCFLAGGKGHYYCRKDLDGEKLVTCGECTSSTVFVKKKNESRLLSNTIR
ncbi:MAG: hypothetical protein ACFFD4_38400 [Candidatus Odinarchaeota archaeon]